MPIVLYLEVCPCDGRYRVLPTLLRLLLLLFFVSLPTFFLPHPSPLLRLVRQLDIVSHTFSDSIHSRPLADLWIDKP